MSRTAVLCACACTAGCGRIGFDAISSADALIGWWKFDEGAGTVAHDSVGTDDGTFDLANITWTTGPNGVAGTALAFAGDGYDLDLGKPPAFANLPALTVSAWLNPSSIGSTAYDNCFFDHGDGTVGWAAGTSYAASGDLSFNAQATGGEFWQESTASALSVGTWTHVVVAWDGSLLASHVAFYANGVALADSDLGAAGHGMRADDSGVEVVIDCNASSGFAGAIADVRLYDRALTVAEVGALDDP